MLKFDNCTFSAAGSNNRAKVYGLTTLGTEDVEIKNCVFNGTGYSAILNKSTGSVTVENCIFECGNFYNPIEGSQTTDNGNVTIENCDFQEVPQNNFINFYRVANDSIHTIKGCKFAGGYDNNIVRLSNTTNVDATFNIDDCSYKFTSGALSDYTGVVLCQDYTSKSGNPQNFSKYTININNLEGPDEGSLVYVYEDGVGIIQTNYPVVVVDGQPRVFVADGPVLEEEEGSF